MIPLGIPVASTGHARGAAFSFPREGDKPDVDERRKMKCNALIDQDQEIKMALVGDALEAALKDPTWPRCGQELAADDVFCPACGAKVNKSLLQGTFTSCDPYPADDYWKCIVFTQPRHCKGRASRGELWKVWLKAALFYVIVLLVVNFRNIVSVELGMAVLAVSSFAIGICTVPVAVRRLHDRGYSGKAIIPSICFSFVYIALALSGNDASFVGVLISIVAAVYNFVLFVLLGFIRGTRGPNKYGPDPLEAT